MIRGVKGDRLVAMWLLARPQADEMKNKQRRNTLK